ncbi:hypothetical protein KC342_g2873 [Hortaea werneckii]|nr:hypothetical protein KC342_g2873 [Hortaea werneckii]KAI7103803.1 hypothetical protein KC339_g4982 [Hortaea werneckii]KAI7406413.1 hypothetical protein KC328_g986 [Hortaea werneckii]
MGVCRAITAFFISPAAAIGSAVVAETFFKKERGKFMGVWTLMVTIGVPIAPFGFAALRVGYRWIYYVLAITNGVQLLLCTLLGPEKRYIRQGVQHTGSSFRQEFLTFKRIDPTPLIGIIGFVLGEQIGGFSSDKWMGYRKKCIGKTLEPEFRLWLSYLGITCTIVGIAVFLIQLERAPELHWNVTPLVGAAIAAAGNQIVTTVMVTYAVDCYREEAASVGVQITFVRQIWGFIGPSWFPPMFENIGLYGSAGLAAGLMFGFSLLPTILIQCKGRSLRH